MKLFKTIATGLTALSIAAASVAFGFNGIAHADCYQYDPNGFQTSSTPVFNNICGAPSINNESDFVRIRQNTATTPAAANDEAALPHYAINSLDATCNNGDMFDVWNYLHNDASQNYNPDTNPNDPSAVAKNVVEHLQLPLGATQSSFTFGDTITADNAATVSDSVTLNCANKEVKLSLVPGSVHTLTSPTGNWNDIADLQAGDNALKVGNPTWGSGDVWGCWNYRVLVVYEVKVTVVPPATPELACTLSDFTVDQEHRKVSVAIQANVKNATVTGYSISWGDNSTSNKQSDTHTYASNVTSATIQASFTATANGQTQTVAGADCMRQVSFKPGTPPSTPPSTPPTPPTKVVTASAPTELVNTGPGSVAAIFTGVAAASAIGYRWFLGRRLNRQ